MDDDIRDRFRGARSGRPAQPAYGRPAQPLRKLAPMPARPQPIPQPIGQAKPQPVPAPLASEPKPNIIRKPAPQHTPKKKRRNNGGKKKLFSIIILLLILLLAVGGFMVYKIRSKKAAPAAASIKLTTEADKPVAPKPSGTIRFIATGDNLAFESINNAAKKPDGSYDYLPLMSDAKPFFDKSDIRLCNQSTPAGGEPLGISAAPNFNAPKSWTTGLAALGCNVINLGAEHTNDKGQPAIDATLDSWDEQKGILAVAGANKSAEQQGKIKYFTVKGVKFAFLSYTTRSNKPVENAFGVSQYSDTLAKTQTAEARKNADLVIVSMNWGNENSSDISADQDRISQQFASQNVDIIVGIGPRVLQPAKILTGTEGHQTLAWFSLGNFLNSQVPVNNLIGGMAIMDIDIASLQIIDPKIMPFYMHYEWTLAQKKSQTQADLLARRGFALYPLDQAEEPLAKSQNSTTVQAQTERVKSVITKFVPIKVIKSTEF